MTDERYPTFGYLKAENHQDLLYGTQCILQDTVTELCISEYALREVTQREKTLQHRFEALEKTTAIEPDGAQLESPMNSLQRLRSSLKRSKCSVSKRARPLHSGVYDSTGIQRFV